MPPHDHFSTVVESARTHERGGANASAALSTRVDLSELGARDDGRRPSPFARCVVGAISFAEYQRVSRRRDRVTRAATRRPQRSRVARRSKTRAARKAAASSDGDGEAPSDDDAEVVVTVAPDGRTRVIVAVDGHVVSLSTSQFPITGTDLTEAVDVARRAIRGDSSVRWSS